MRSVIHTRLGLDELGCQSILAVILCRSLLGFLACGGMLAASPLRAPGLAMSAVAPTFCWTGLDYRIAAANRTVFDAQALFVFDPYDSARDLKQDELRMRTVWQISELQLS